MRNGDVFWSARAHACARACRRCGEAAYQSPHESHVLTVRVRTAYLQTTVVVSTALVMPGTALLSRMFPADIWSMGIVFLEVLCYPGILARVLSFPRLAQNDPQRKQKEEVLHRLAAASDIRVLLPPNLHAVFRTQSSRGKN